MDFQNDKSDDPNYYKNYIEPFPDYQDSNLASQLASEPPKHKYTIHLHRAVFTDEVFELYKRYELAVHKKEREKPQLVRFLCNSPLYDEQEVEIGHSPMFFKTTDIDERWHAWKDEGVYPKHKGTYHMYHRIDGKLVAFGVIDICTRFFNSAYFVYDPDYKFLNLGVVGAIREMEYMRMVKKHFNPMLHFYQLGEMVPSCPKVNYKQNYQPGMVICPRTKRDIWWADVQDQAKILEQLPIAEKQDYAYIQLDPQAGDAPLPEEMLVNILADKVDDMTVLYEDRRHVRFSGLSEGGKKHIYPFAL